MPSPQLVCWPEVALPSGCVGLLKQHPLYELEWNAPPPSPSAPPTNSLALKTGPWMFFPRSPALRVPPTRPAFCPWHSLCHNVPRRLPHIAQGLRCGKRPEFTKRGNARRYEICWKNWDHSAPDPPSFFGILTQKELCTKLGKTRISILPIDLCLDVVLGGFVEEGG